MIIVEDLQIGGRDYTRTYSDKGVYIANAKGEKYADAVHMKGKEDAYVETDDPIDAGEATESDKDAALTTLGVNMEE